MKSIVRGGIVASVVAALALSAAGVAGAAGPKPKKQSPAKYAKTVCTAYSGVLNGFNSYGKSIQALDSTAPDFLTQAGNQTNALLAQVKGAETTLQGAYPDISNGKKVGNLLVANATELDQGLTDALNKLNAGGPAGGTLFGVSIQTLGTKLSDPFSKVTDQTLINAFQKEKACKSVVTVFG